MDLRYSTPLPQMGICNVEPQLGNLGIQGAMLLDPGLADHSIIHTRMDMVGGDQMPPFARSEIDAAGVALIDEYINDLVSCTP